MKYSISEELKKEFTELKIRAKEIGYKNVFPKLPKEQFTQKAFENVMMGFEMRFHNWKKGLSQLENPSGNIFEIKKTSLDNTSDKKIDLSHFVTNSFEGLEKLTGN